MKKFVPWNINNSIKVVLTKKGYTILREHHNGVVTHESDEDGFYTFPMWEFMKIFGSRIDICNEPCSVCVLIEFPEFKKLKEEHEELLEKYEIMRSIQRQ